MLLKILVYHTFYNGSGPGVPGPPLFRRKGWGLEGGYLFA